MNAERRKEIEKARNMIGLAFSQLEEARSLIDDLISEEQEYFDNMSESFQEGEKGEKATAAIDALQSAHDEIDGFDFDSIFDSLDTAAE